MHDDIDLAIRTNFEPNEDSNLIVRDVIKTDHCLVASPELLQGRIIEHYSELQDFPSISLGTQKQNLFGIYAIFVMVKLSMCLINHESKVMIWLVCIMP